MTRNEQEEYAVMMSNYLTALIDRIFKILPMYESSDETLPQYVESLCGELKGCKILSPELCEDAIFASIICVLLNLNNEKKEHNEVKKSVFRAISDCKKLRSKYFE